jgi:hypothetical protein
MRAKYGTKSAEKAKQKNTLNAEPNAEPLDDTSAATAKRTVMTTGSAATTIGITGPLGSRLCDQDGTAACPLTARIMPDRERYGERSEQRCGRSEQQLWRAFEGELLQLDRHRVFVYFPI